MADCTAPESIGGCCRWSEEWWLSGVQLVSAMGINLTEAELSAAMKEMDEDGNDEVDFGEFVSTQQHLEEMQAFLF